MKTNYLLILYMSFIALLMGACKTEDVITGIKIEEKTCALGISETKQLNACVYPNSNSDNCGLITWSSSNTDIATVDKDGLVQGIARGEAVVYATLGSFTAKCYVTVIEKGVVLPVSLTGTDYYLISMDNYSAAAIFDKTKADYRPNETSNAMYIWRDTVNHRDTYYPGTCSGLNFYGEEKEWVSLIVDGAGWSGARFYSNDTILLDKIADIIDNPNEYYLHIALKDTTNTVYMFGLFDNNNYRFAVGATNFDDNGDLIPNMADFVRNGEWQEINIPMSIFDGGGFKYTHDMGGINVFWLLSGDVPGTKIEMDAVFIYKKPL